MQEVFEKIPKPLYYIALFAFLGFFAIYASFGIHIDYLLPFHADEWDHLAIANEIARTNSLISYNPFIGSGWDPQWERNYHLLLAILLNTTGFDQTDLGSINLALILPTFMTFLMMLFSFVLVMHLTENKIAALIASITVLFTSSNVTLLGYWFLVPMAYGLAFLPITLLLFVKSFESIRYSILLFLVFAQTALVHPASATIFLPAFLLYAAINPKLLWKNKGKIGILLLELAVIALVLAGFSIYQYEFSSYTDLFDKILQVLTFPSTLYEVNAFFFFPRFLTYPIFALSILGAFYLVGFKKREAWILPLMALTLTPIVYLFFVQGTSFLAEYRRIFMIVATVLVIMSGIGIFAVLEFFNNLVRKYSKNFTFFGKITPNRIYQITALLIVSYLLFFHLASVPVRYYPSLYKVIDEYQVPALVWLKHNSNQEEAVIAQPWISRAIGVISGNRIYYVTTARLSGTRDFREADNFWPASCEEKLHLLHGAKIVLSTTGIQCDFLHEVYEKDEVYIYRVAT